MINKKIYLSLGILALAFFLVGCQSTEQSAETNVNANSQQEENNQKDDSQDNAALGQENQNNLQLNENMAEVSADELAEDMVIMVIGESSDTGVVAQQIIVNTDGFNAEDFMKGPGNMPEEGMESEDMSEIPEGLEEKAMPADFNPEDRPNFADMEEMSDEDKQAFMEEMKNKTGGNVNSDRGTKGVAMQSMVQLKGTIISLDGSSLVISLADGGSKIIFLTDETFILGPKTE